MFIFLQIIGIEYTKEKKYEENTFSFVDIGNLLVSRLRNNINGAPHWAQTELTRYGRTSVGVE